MRLPAADPFDAGPFARWLRPGMGHTVRRAVLAAAVAWLPLVLLAAAQGHLTHPSPRESLLHDLTAYARYLVAVPAFILAEGLTLPVLGAIAREFVNAGIVPARDRPRYDAVVASVRRLLAHRGVQALLLVLAYGVAIQSLLLAPRYAVWRVVTTDEWIAPLVGGERRLSLAGWWAMLVSQPIFLLLVAMWLWRVLVWTRFLWGMSRLDLQLVAAHPDRAGGLYFVSTSLRAFALVAFPLGAAVAGVIAEETVDLGRPLTELRAMALAACAAIVLLFALPLVVLAVPLARARVRAVFAYGNLAVTLGRAFEARWLARDTGVTDEALSVQDFSATTDLYAITDNVGKMRLLPLGIWPVLTLAFGAALPMLLVSLASVTVARVLEVLRMVVLGR